MKHDYDLTELKKIEVRNLDFNIMPRYLYHYTDKEYEEFSLDLLDYLVGENGVAIDIGSHYGIYSLLSARKAKKVYAFEPVPENFEILKKNIQDNNFQDIITPINKAVSDKKGDVTFNMTWASDSAGFYEHPNAEVIKKITVHTNSIDQELKDVRDVEFIKIDTEGHELHVLDGLKTTLRNNKKAKMLIEFNPECLVNAGSGSRQLIDKILSMDYDIFAVHEEARYMIRVDGSVSDEDILAGELYLNFLCLPKGSWDNLLFTSHSSDIGGAEMVLFETIQALVNRKDIFIMPTVILPGYGPLLEKMKSLPISINVVPMHGWTNNKDVNGIVSAKTKADDTFAMGRIAKIFKEFQPRVAVTNTLALPWGAIVAKVFDVPHVWSIHEFGDLDHKLDFDYGFETSLRTINDLSDKVYANSNAVADHIKKYIDTSKLAVLPLNVNPPRLSEKSVPNVFSNMAELKLTICGRVSPSKGQLDAVKALVALRKSGYKAELAIIGSASEEYLKEITTYCEKNNVSQFVHILGFKENPFDYVAMGDINLTCSDNEAFGRVTVEAMLLGKPVVAANSGGSLEIIEDGKTGLLYKAHSTQDLAKKIESLTDKKKAKSIGEEGRRSAEAKYFNNYYERFYDDSQIKHAMPRRNTQLIYTDLLEGLYRAQDRKNGELEDALQKYREDISNFSDEYNKVYAAYNELEAHLAEIRGHKIVKLVDKAKSLKNKLKSRKS